MVKREYYVRQDQTDFLRSLSGTEAEHVRRAIDDYVKKVKSEIQKSSLSPSKRKEDDQDGKENNESSS